jgi:hypothetical protein
VHGSQLALCCPPAFAFFAYEYKQLTRRRVAFREVMRDESRRVPRVSVSARRLRPAVVLSPYRHPLFGCHLLSCTPGPPPFSSMNSTPATCRARNRFAIVMDIRTQPPTGIAARLRTRRLVPPRIRRGYFCLECRGLRSRKPSPPPFWHMNSIPARSKAARIASTAPRETSRRSFSKSTTVESPRLAACASCDWVIPSSPRAARHWAGVILSTFFIDMPLWAPYQ